MVDEFLVSSKLAAQHLTKQKGYKHIIPLSLMDTKNINALVKRLIKYSDAYIHMLG